MEDSNDWNEYKQLVLAELKRIDLRLGRLEEQVGAVKTKLSNIYAIAIFVGTMTGIIIAGLDLVVNHLL